MQILPYFEAFTPKFERVRCLQVPGSGVIECSSPYTVGGTYSGASLTPIILRWNLTGHGRLVPFAQAAGGLLWTNHKFPAYGSTVPNLNVNGPNGETSVWNFTPQGGIGFHYFTTPRRSIDFTATGMHISSASLGDRNPGVNASVQFSVGYSWWK
jgi:lipid A 3-O-deacylase